MRFKVGDKVRLIGDALCAPIEKGAVVTIDKISNSWGVVEFYYSIAGKGVGYVGLKPHWELVEDEKFHGTQPEKTTLPQDSKKRKEFPIYSGPIKYFPKALAEVARVCKIGNDKHNPGQELHHARGKSNDHADCIIRHLIDMSEDFGEGVGRDENGVPQVAYIAWRALALAQVWLEKNDGAPTAPGANE